jgi:hypothetical protein
MSASRSLTAPHRRAEVVCDVSLRTGHWSSLPVGASGVNPWRRPPSVRRRACFTVGPGARGFLWIPLASAWPLFISALGKKGARRACLHPRLPSNNTRRAGPSSPRVRGSKKLPHSGAGHAISVERASADFRVSPGPILIV